MSSLNSNNNSPDCSSLNQNNNHNVVMDLKKHFLSNKMLTKTLVLKFGFKKKLH